MLMVSGVAEENPTQASSWIQDTEPFQNVSPGYKEGYLLHFDQLFFIKLKN